MKIKIKIFVIFLLSLILSFIPSDDKTIITKDTLINSTLQLFGVTLAIIALLFTILDRYKANLENSQKLILEKKSFPILKNMVDDVLATLLLAVIIFFYDIFYIPLQWIQDFPFISYIHLDRFILLSLLFFLLAITLDITISIITLINGLIEINRTHNESIQPTENELQLISIVRKFDSKHFEELLDYIKTLVVKQELDK